MPDKMSQYHWLKIKPIFQIYCADGTLKSSCTKGLVLARCEFELLPRAVWDPVCDGWGGEGQGRMTC